MNQVAPLNIFSSKERINSSWVISIGEVLWDMLPSGKQCGGAPANVVYHLNRLGIRSAVVSAVGNDSPGDELLQFLESKGISTQFITRNALPTGTVSVTLQNGIPSYDIHCPVAWDSIVLSHTLKNNIKSISALIWGTLAQRSSVSHDAIIQLLSAVPQDCLKCFDINLRQNYYNADLIDKSLHIADVLKINEEELAIISKLFKIPGSKETVIRQLYLKYELKYIICTLGEHGSMLYDGINFTSCPIKSCKVVDTVGCGDAFLAAWCAAILKGGTAKQGMLAGTELSSIVAGQSGAMGI